MSIFRNAVWIVKGLKEYTSGGFNAAAKGFNPSDLDVNCQGKAYMITGQKQLLKLVKTLDACRGKQWDWEADSSDDCAERRNHPHGVQVGQGSA